jgi:hypothetical protein
MLPVFLSMHLLAAHFFRAGNQVFVYITLASPFLLILRRPWVVRIIRLELLLGGIEWIRTLSEIAMMRQSAAMPWTRLAFILSVVALMTFCSTLVFRAGSLRKRYNL